MREIASRWIVILAGGQGARVAHLTRESDGTQVPKQYWDFGTGVSLLRRTLDRAESLVPRERIVVAVDERHRRWWVPALSGLPAGNVVAQARDFGTALGVLGPVARIIRQSPRAVVLVLPSDHFVEREAVLRESLERAFEASEHAPGRIALLGITPEEADPDYGWLVLGKGDPESAASPRPVEAFAEKPGAAEAERLMARGAFWSSFIFAATAATLVGLFRSVRPGMLHGYLERARATAWDPAVPLDLEGLPALDFSRDLLERSSGVLRVLVVKASGWTDLGTPARVAAWQRRRSTVLSA
jgi:mannose-1-phosphate guanylyltransferase